MKELINLKGSKKETEDVKRAGKEIHVSVKNGKSRTVMLKFAEE